MKSKTNKSNAKSRFGKGEGSIVRYISRTKQQELSGELSLDGSYDNLDRWAGTKMSRDTIGTQSVDHEKIYSK